VQEIALNILDIAQNSVKAGASLIEISVGIDTVADTLTVTIADDGCGMDEEQLKRVTDPFFTTRTTRKVGMGVSFFKMAAELTGGKFDIRSQKGVGTVVTAGFTLSHIDRMPLGDVNGVIEQLIVFDSRQGDKPLDFVYNYRLGDLGFTLSTVEIRELLGDVPLSSPDVKLFIREFLKENTDEINAGAVF
jgi:anti-sigma regulatory factor (Ser/Thr protein kinase)